MLVDESNKLEKQTQAVCLTNKPLNRRIAVGVIVMYICNDTIASLYSCIVVSVVVW